MQSSYNSKTFRPPGLPILDIPEEEEGIASMFSAMGDTVKKILLNDDYQILTSSHYADTGNAMKFSSFQLFGKMAETGWKTNIIIRKDNDQMISFEVKLPRGRCSYYTDILASFATEEVMQKYAEYALVQLLRTNDREDVLLDSFS